jgi:hypothetical protein
MAEDVSGSMTINASGAQASIGALQSGFNKLFDSMSDSSAMKSLATFDILSTIISKVTEVTKQLISESKDLIAISVRYDIPINKMGQLQMAANLTGQSIGQVARNLRFFENNISKSLLKVGSPQAQFFDKLGISIEQREKGLVDTNYMLDVVREKVMTIGDEERRNAILAEGFGANWALMLPMLEANKTELADMAAQGHTYSESMTRALATVSSNTEGINQNIKPLAEFFAAVFAMLTTGIAAAVLGVMTLGKIIKDGIGGAITWIISVWDRFTASMEYGLGLIEEAIPGGSDGKERQANAIKKFQKGQQKADSADFFDDKAFAKAAQQGQMLQDRFAQTGYAVAESMGMVEENALIKDTVKQIDEKKASIATLVAESLEYRKQIDAVVALEQAGLISAEQKKKTIEEIRELQGEVNEKITEEQESLRDLQAIYDRIKDTTKDINKDKGNKPQTVEEAKTDFDKFKAEGEQKIKDYMAGTPIGEQKETFFAIVEARMKQIKLEQEMEEMKRRGLLTIQAQAQYEKEIAAAKSTVIEKERAHEAFLLKQARQRADSERDRKEIIISAMAEREQTFMARQGMTGIDKQTTAFSNSIEKLQRDQARLAEYENDPKRTQEEKLAAKKDVEASAIAAQKELDKTTLMQFQYGASDAAKKGMGGGIDIRENQLSISKDQLSVLQKQLDLMYKQYNLDPADYGGTPMVMQGPFRSPK